MTLVYLTLAFAGGILAGHFFRQGGVLLCGTPSWFFPSAAVLVLSALLLLRKRPFARLAAALGLFIVLGAWRYAADPFERCLGPADLASYHPGEDGIWATVEGVVIGYPDVRDRGTQYQLDVERVVIDGQPHEVHGRTLIEASRQPLYAYGDRLAVSGVLRTPPISDDFNYRRYLATRSIHTLIRHPHIERLESRGGQLFWRVLYGVRSRASGILNRILPEPAAALTNGMVLGIEGGISEEVSTAFEITGTTHLIVISGSNIAFLSGALIAILGGLMARRRAAMLAAPLVLLYVLLVGADPPALRAGVMGLLGLGAVYFGRRGTAYVSLCAAGMVMLAINPLALWDIGFQLSFATSLGLILFSRPLGNALASLLQRGLSHDDARRLVRVFEGTLIVTVAAQAAALPLILYHFGQLSPVSLVTNCLVLPVQPAILASGIASLLAGAVWQPLGQFVAALPWALLSYEVGVIRATASVPFASVNVGPVSPLVVIWCYALFAAVSMAPRVARRLHLHVDLRHAAAWTALLVVPASLSWFAWRSLPDGRLHVLYVPGEDAEAVLITAPDGRAAWLWDGRGDGDALMHRTLASQATRGQPDLVLAHCEASPWRQVPCINPAELPTAASVALTPEVLLQRVDTGGPAALLLTYGRFRTLLPTTLAPAAQAAVQGRLHELSVLKAAGPGTGAWPSAGFLRAAEPQLVLWPQETTYPPEVSEYLTTQVTAARVEADGVVEVVSDGGRFWVMRHSAVGPR